MLIVAVLAFAVFLGIWLYTPFKPSTFLHRFDVSDDSSEIDALVDNYIAHGGFDEILSYNHELVTWRGQCLKTCDKSLFKRHRMKQLNVAWASVEEPFVFVLGGQQKRYSLDELHKKYDSWQASYLGI